MLPVIKKTILRFLLQRQLEDFRPLACNIVSVLKTLI